MQRLSIDYLPRRLYSRPRHIFVRNIGYDLQPKPQHQSKSTLQLREHYTSVLTSNNFQSGGFAHFFITLRIPINIFCSASLTYARLN